MASPIANFSLTCATRSLNLSITEKYLVANDRTVSVLDLQCRHLDQAECSHRREIEVNKVWDVATCKDIMATVHDDGTLRVWSLESG
jgi:hypothetical protein